ncbi:MAG TPA: phosphotransferase [Candidatus Dorea intestinavium]|nr:phosphotransferase [Candidatus Dorea intestinavium]
MTIDPLITRYLESDFFKSRLKIPTKANVSWDFLAQGEYNLNVVFLHPVTKKNYVLRMNFGSQMDLESQLRYEANALKLLAKTKRTPLLYLLDDSKKVIETDVLIMEYLPGEPLNYHTDIPLAMEILADIHSLKLPQNHGLVTPSSPVEAILLECRKMFSHYETSSLAKPQVVTRVKQMLNHLTKKSKSLSITSTPYRCLINTELNNTNFLINGAGKENYLIDWEKPIYASPAQDLGHFFAPTTTFWKTDVFLSPKEINKNIDYYIARVDNRFPTSSLKEEINTYLEVTCLRGITWCAMAFVDYNSGEKKLTNESTRLKLGQYISQQFLDKIETSYLV